jgi:AcrR family transcriptional regulator
MAKISDSDDDLKELIITTTEKLLHRYGAKKLSVVDVAREIGMSHGNVYRFFSSKSVLLGAISERWLSKVMTPLTVIIESDEPAEKKLVKWIDTLRTIKRQRCLDEPEVFALYGEIREEAGDAVIRHIEHLLDQLQSIVEQGKTEGVFHVTDTRQAAAAILSATARLHHPAFVTAPDYPSETEARYLINMVVVALKFVDRDAH